MADFIKYLGLTEKFLKHKKDLSGLKHSIKKLAYLRYNLGIALDMNDPKETTGGHEERLAFLREVVRRGWEVTIYSEIKKDYRSYLENPPAGLEFLKKIKYKPEELIEKNTDLVYVEHGPTNMMFRNSYIDESHIFRTYELLANYEGVVFYHQSDPDLFFGINGYAFSASFYKNLKFGTPEQILKGCQYAILSKAKFVGENGKLFKEANSMYRAMYDKINYDYLWWPSAFLGHRPGSFPIKDKPTRELCYIGSQKGRYNKFEQYYNTDGKLTVDLYGNWDIDFLKSRLPFIKYNGSIPQMMCEEIYNDSLCHVVIASEGFERLGVINTRYSEATTSNTAVLIDANLAKSIGTPEKFTIKNRQDALEKYDLLKRQTPQQRREFIEEHRDFVMSINPVTLIDDLEIFYNQQREKMVQPGWKDLIENFKLGQYEFEQQALYDKDRMIRNKHVYLRMFKELNYVDGVTLKQPPTYPDGGLPRCCVSCGKLIISDKAYASRVRCKNCGGQWDSYPIPLHKYEIFRNKEWITKVYKGTFEQEKIKEYLKCDDTVFYEVSPEEKKNVNLEEAFKIIDEYMANPPVINNPELPAKKEKPKKKRKKLEELPTIETKELKIDFIKTEPNVYEFLENLKKHIHLREYIDGSLGIDFDKEIMNEMPSSYKLTNNVLMDFSLVKNPPKNCEIKSDEVKIDQKELKKLIKDVTIEDIIPPMVRQETVYSF
jgi:hypothetical protein